jgi:hypothetical protein
MKGLSPSAELLRFYKRGEWYEVEMALDGVKADFEVPVPYIWDMFDTPDGERKVAEYLERQAQTMIERYGDSRNPRPDPELVGKSEQWHG